jgi:hypothetical protein
MKPITFSVIVQSAALLAAASATAAGPAAPGGGLRVSVTSDGRYAIGIAGSSVSALTAGVAVEVDGRWFRSSDYPTHTQHRTEVQGELGLASEWKVTSSGKPGAPDLVYQLRAYRDRPFADIKVIVRNGTGRAIAVQAIRDVDAAGAGSVNLGGPDVQDRVLSDSFSEDRPAMRIRDLADAPYREPPPMHRAVGSQLLFNRASGQSLFVGALTSDQFLTVLRLHLDSSPVPRITGWAVESTGTTELEAENSLKTSAAVDHVPLSLPVAPGASLSAERALLGVSSDYHDQLETYGALVRQIHTARVAAPPLLGWWSWTAYYFGLNDRAALTNAEWQAQHLLPLGYNVFHIDEGYQFARGEYATPNATLFPQGLTPLEYKVRGLGLTPGIWTAPFEVSQRSWVFEHHSDWLVKNAKGAPIKAGWVLEGKDQLYVLDVTNPDAADYLRQTYTTLVHEWGIHYIKLDFMDDSAVEGFYYRPHTTAMEAQRIGLGIIRQAVGDDVYLDKDGSVMLNPVGLVDYGRLSQDTGHTFDATREAAPGIAARYYMNRNYFVADPDAFAVSTQTIADQSWHESRKPSTIEEARAAIALAAVTAGMFEVGDNLPTLEKEPERLALLENRDLLDMLQLGRSSKPTDLMEYRAEDVQPTTFFLKESPRQSILTVFNWTGKAVERTIPLADLGIAAGGRYDVADVLEGAAASGPQQGVIRLTIPAESVRMLKIVDRDVPATPPTVTVVGADSGRAGQAVTLSANQTGGSPLVSWTWRFGDGVTANGRQPSHTWTEPGDYSIQVTARSVDGNEVQAQRTLHITGTIPTTFEPEAIRRPEP